MQTSQKKRLKREFNNMKLTKWQNWKKIVFDHEGRIFMALGLLVIGIIATIASGNYVDGVKATAVRDIILNAIPTINLSFIFTWGLLFVLAIYLVYPFIFKPKKLHYALGLLGLLLIARSLFMIMTHLKVPQGVIHMKTDGIFSFLKYQNDLFFSGHTAIPFLGFLVYNENKILKYFMLMSSIVLGITVLAMHIHYTIDVAGAYFITYGVFTLGNKLFNAN
jgi:hypothetical protein